ncbi:MAG: Crp/Fnr family transcriptional regulator [Phormidesmis sp.]
MAFALHLAPDTAPRSPVARLRSPHRETPSRNKRKDKLVQFNRHDQIPNGDNKLWQIQSGYVRTLSWNSEGDPIPLGFWRAGDIFGEAIARTSPYEAQCLSSVTARPLNMEAGFSYEAAMAQVQQSNDLLRIVHCRQLNQSLLQFLCWLASRFGQPTHEGLEIPVKLIHQDIADAIGATRVTIARQIKQLEREGKLRWSGSEKVVYTTTLSQFSLDSDCQLEL